MNVLWTMDLFVAIGVSHLKATMEQSVTTQQTAKVLKKQLAEKLLSEQFVCTRSVPPGYDRTSVHLCKTLLLMSVHPQCHWPNFNKLNIFRRYLLFVKTWIMLLEELMHS